MKNITVLLSLALLVFISVGCKKSNKISANLIQNPISASGKNDLSKLPVIKFDVTEHDFGDLTHGESIRYSFKFKNVGNSDLIISDVKASCGCTIAEFPKMPIKPGEENFIDVLYDSKGNNGFQNKYVNVVSNAQPNITRLTIKANVRVK